MNTDELKAILDKHLAWLRDEPDGLRANLRGANPIRADLSRADLRGADLSRANLIRADLSDADLSDADLTRADLSRANLSRADLSRADLRGADLSRADLTRADLSDADLRDANLTRANLRDANLRDTCLSTNLMLYARTFAHECRPTRRGGRIVYRTAVSRHVGKMKYEPGHTYIAPYLSWSVETACHPGIYAASLEWMRREHPGDKLVRCYVRDGDWTITAKGAIRCERLRVLGYVND